jgi:hypothetical protein
MHNLLRAPLTPMAILSPTNTKKQPAKQTIAGRMGGLVVVHCHLRKTMGNLHKRLSVGDHYGKG